MGEEEKKPSLGPGGEDQFGKPDVKEEPAYKGSTITLRGDVVKLLDRLSTQHNIPKRDLVEVALLTLQDHVLDRDLIQLPELSHATNCLENVIEILITQLEYYEALAIQIASVEAELSIGIDPSLESVYTPPEPKKQE